MKNIAFFLLLVPYTVLGAQIARLETMFSFDHHQSIENFSNNTFIFFINGAADHSVLKTRSNLKRGSINADQWDAEKINELSKSCKGCNVVLLHIQPAKEDRITYLRIHSGGKEIYLQQMPLLNAADPHVLGDLLKISESLFSYSYLHLIYRGHPFLERDEARQRAPFDCNFPQTIYGLHEFTQGLLLGTLKNRLSSLTFASCNMAFIEAAKAISLYAKYMIASQTTVVETQDFGFDYSFLTQVNDNHSEDDVAKIIANSLLSAFRVNDTQLLNAFSCGAPIMESSISLIRLKRMNSFTMRFENLLNAIRHEFPDFFQVYRDDILKNSKITKLVSNRYIEYVKLKNNNFRLYIDWKQNSHPYNNYLDLWSFLQFLKQRRNLTSDMRKAISELISDFEKQIYLFDRPDHSTKKGLSFIFD